MKERYLSTYHFHGRDFCIVRRQVSAPRRRRRHAGRVAQDSADAEGLCLQASSVTLIARATAGSGYLRGVRVGCRLFPDAASRG